MMSFAFFGVDAQPMQFEAPLMLNRRVNSPAEESLPILSADGNTLYFVRMLHPRNKGGKFKGQDIWYCKKDTIKGGWKTAKNYGVLNQEMNEAVVGIYGSGDTICIQRSVLVGNEIVPRLYIGHTSGLNMKPLSIELAFQQQQEEEKFSKKKGKEEEDEKVVVNYFGANMVSEGDVMFVSMQGEESLGEEDLYVCFKYSGWNRYYKDEGSKTGSWWSKPIHLGKEINSSKFEISPFLSPDGKTLFFSSNRKGGQGNADIYRSERLDDTWTNWSKPVNLGPSINSRFFDAFFIMDSLGNAYFSSNRQKNRLSDIYQTKLVNVQEFDMANKNVSVKTDPAVVAAMSTRSLEGNIEEDKTLKEDAEDLALDLFSLGDSVQVLFDLGSHRLFIDYRYTLDKVLLTLQVNKGWKIEVHGFTDDIGQNHHNQTLSERRATEVRDYLMSHGLTKDRFVVVGKGESLHTHIADIDEARKHSRRVEITFMDSEASASR